MKAWSRPAPLISSAALGASFVGVWRTLRSGAWRDRSEGITTVTNCALLFPSIICADNRRFLLHAIKRSKPAWLYLQAASVAEYQSKIWSANSVANNVNVLPCLRGEVEAQIKPMRLLSRERITDDPVFIGYIKDAASVDRLIAGALGRSTEKIKARRAPSFHQSRLRERLFRFSPAIRNLVEPINAYGVVGRGSFEPVAKIGRMLGVSVTSRINNQRPAPCSNLHVQHVIVAVPAIAERSAIEDQEAFMVEWMFLSPAAPLNVVACVRKTDVSLLRRHALRAGVAA